MLSLKTRVDNFKCDFLDNGYSVPDGVRRLVSKWPVLNDGCDGLRRFLGFGQTLYSRSGSRLNDRDRDRRKRSFSFL
jgi:hypothetical protein